MSREISVFTRSVALECVLILGEHPLSSPLTHAEQTGYQITPEAIGTETPPSAVDSLRSLGPTRAGGQASPLLPTRAQPHALKAMSLFLKIQYGGGLCQEMQGVAARKTKP